MATAVIIASTTLNYTFVGISILFALLLMRGGVLILAPFVDHSLGRRVDAASWVALGLSFLALGIALAEVGGYQMTLIAGLNIAAYLLGYSIRIPIMTGLAKSHDPALNRRYFHEETLIAAIALTGVPAFFALMGSGEIMLELRVGFSTFFASPLVVPALLIGVLYGCLYLFGTGVYLDPRENTYCIPLNRCSSLLSGIIASFGLTFLLDVKPPERIPVRRRRHHPHRPGHPHGLDPQRLSPSRSRAGSATGPLRLLGQYQPIADGPGHLQ